MKYIVHIKLPHGTPPEEMVKIRDEAKKRFAGQEDNYIIIVTGEVDIDVYPKLLYNVGLWWSRFKTWLKNLINRT